MAAQKSWTEMTTEPEINKWLSLTFFCWAAQQRRRGYRMRFTRTERKTDRERGTELLAGRLFTSFDVDWRRVRPVGKSFETKIITFSIEIGGDDDQVEVEEWMENFEGVSLPHDVIWMEASQSHDYEIIPLLDFIAFEWSKHYINKYKYKWSVVEWNRSISLNQFILSESENNNNCKNKYTMYFVNWIELISRCNRGVIEIEIGKEFTAKCLLLAKQTRLENRKSPWASRPISRWRASVINR